MEWIRVTSTRATAIAHDASRGMIYVRFNDGTEYWYGPCPASVWEEFSAVGTSKGRYISRVLDRYPKGRR